MIYLEVETGELKSGYNRIEVTVYDEVAGRSVSKSAIVSIGN